jgi:N6-adenosine-specific RNA methylase IME4
MEKNQGAVRGKTGRKGKPVLDTKPKLSDLGVTKTQSSQWQRLAGMQPEAFEECINAAKRKAVNVRNGAGKRTRQEMHAEDEARVKLLRPIAGTFLTLVIDPPWRSDWLSESAQATPGYATMSVEELLALPVLQWAAEQCHLYLWTPNNFMPVACKLVEHWGFAHKQVITWRKPRWGQGQYFRNQTEHVLFSIKGDLRTRSDSLPNIFDAPIGEHSEKPEEFYELVRKASYLPAGEAFQRKARPEFINLFAPAAEVSVAPHPARHSRLLVEGASVSGTDANAAVRFLGELFRCSQSLVFIISRGKVPADNVAPHIFTREKDRMREFTRKWDQPGRAAGSSIPGKVIKQRKGRHCLERIEAWLRTAKPVLQLRWVHPNDDLADAPDRWAEAEEGDE